MTAPIAIPPVCATCAKLAMVTVGDRMFCTDCAREELYSRRCAIPSDINQHLPLLRWLAERCEHVTEMGTREAVSTVAFLAAQPEDLVCWDLSPSSVLGEPVRSLARLAGSTRFQPRVGNTLKITTEPTDLLFIDTLHTGKQLWDELVRHADPRAEPTSVRKYLVFHDTFVYGLIGEDGKPGLRTAIRQYQKYHAFPLWAVMTLQEPVGDLPAGTLCDIERNNGLIVLRHVCADGHSPELLRGQCTWCGRKVAT